MPLVLRSHRHVAAALHMLGSGAMIEWQQAYERDKQALTTILEEAPSLESEFLELNAKELQAKLADVYRIQLQLEKLTDKYRAVLASDDAERERIREANDNAQRGR